jgi:Bacterial PH domain
LAVSWVILRVDPGAPGSVAIVAVLLVTRVLLWWDRLHVLTDRRVVISHGLIVRVEESLGVDRIQHTTLRQGPIGRLLGYGDIDILAAGRGQETLNSIAGVRMFHAALTTAVSGGRPGGVGLHGRSPLPSYEPGSAYAPPLGYVGAAPVGAGGGRR